MDRLAADAGLQYQKDGNLSGLLQRRVFIWMRLASAGLAGAFLKQMKKNDTIQCAITGLGRDGEGIGHYEGMTFFIPGALPGDTVRAGVTKLKKTYGYARVVDVLEPSPDRVSSPCPVSSRCGGCSLLNYAYPAQLRLKETIVRDDLIRIGGFDPSFVDEIREPVIGMKNPLHYRNKAAIPVGLSPDGRLIAGFYARHSHRIIEPDPETGCLIGAPFNGIVTEAVKSWMRTNHVRPYDETAGKGLVRHILIRHGVHTGEVMVCLVINGTGIPAGDQLVAGLRSCFASEETGPEHPALASVCLNINRNSGNGILGERTECIWGSPTITDRVGDISFAISAKSFFQVNPVQMEKLYAKALEYAGLQGTENVYDLYSGIGTISLFLARNAGHVTGIEVVPDAVKDAVRNAKINRITNTSFYTGKTEDVLPKLTAQGRSADVVVLDPPRKGAEPSVLETILSASPSRIVYVSCDPATLARDLKILCADGAYELKRYTPVDQFPESVHVETVCLMSRVEGK